ncbi:hypothetical protein [uncultured Stenotrophomonas sp.]|uniref:hypothetical protein n=1 Tax=uncultured Stenotrophomonas sp. TaxID=165438 RepID=UPI0025DEE182|nr:hypothetical protein [uncultured Stenotrophomonas sp.]
MNMSVALAPSSYRDAAALAAQPSKEVAAPRAADRQAHERLTELVTSQLLANRGTPARQGGAQPELRDPALTLPAAQARVATLKGVLTSALQPSPEAPPPRGSDAAAGSRNAPPPEMPKGGWMANSSFSQLLALLRELLLRFEKMERDQGSRMVMIARDMTIKAGDKGVQKANESFGGAVGGLMVMGAVTGTGAAMSMKGSHMQTKSMTKPANAGTQEAIAGTKTKVAIDSNAPMAHRNDATNSNNGIAENSAAKHAQTMAEAQVPIAQGYALNQLGNASNGLVTSGVNIQAETTEAERQMALQVVDVQRRVADEEQDQANKTRDQRDATAQLVDTLLNMQASTSGHIIGRY